MAMPKPKMKFKKAPVHAMPKEASIRSMPEVEKQLQSGIDMPRAMEKKRIKGYR